MPYYGQSPEDVAEEERYNISNIIQGVLSWAQEFPDSKLIGVWKKYRLPPEIVGKYVLTCQVMDAIKNRESYWSNRMNNGESFERRVCEEHLSVLADLKETCQVVITRYQRVISAYADYPFVKAVPPPKPQAGGEEVAFTGAYESDLDKIIRQAKEAEQGKRLAKERGKVKQKKRTKKEELDVSFSGDVEEEEPEEE